MARPAAADQQPSNDPEPDDKSDVLNSVEFYCYCYKVLPCAKRYTHDWSNCPFAHKNEKARRRDPRRYQYESVPCPDHKSGAVCPRSDACPYAHGVLEYWLHPSRYRTQVCQNGATCKRPLCFFAHSTDQLRFPESRFPSTGSSSAARGGAGASTSAGAASTSDASSPVGAPTTATTSSPKPKPSPDAALEAASAQPQPVRASLKQQRRQQKKAAAAAPPPSLPQPPPPKLRLPSPAGSPDASPTGIGALMPTRMSDTGGASTSAASGAAGAGSAALAAATACPSLPGAPAPVASAASGLMLSRESLEGLASSHLVPFGQQLLQQQYQQLLQQQQQQQQRIQQQHQQQLQLQQQQLQQQLQLQQLRQQLQHKQQLQQQLEQEQQLQQQWHHLQQYLLPAELHGQLGELQHLINSPQSLQLLHSSGLSTSTPTSDALQLLCSPQGPVASTPTSEALYLGLVAAQGASNMGGYANLQGLRQAPAAAPMAGSAAFAPCAPTLQLPPPGQLQGIAGGLAARRLSLADALLPAAPTGLVGTGAAMHPHAVSGSSEPLHQLGSVAAAPDLRRSPASSGFSDRLQLLRPAVAAAAAGSSGQAPVALAGDAQVMQLLHTLEL